VIVSIDVYKEPNTYEYSLKHDIWIKAMNIEITTLQQNNTWTVTFLLVDKTNTDHRG